MRRANFKSYLTPKVDSILKLNNYYVAMQIAHVFRTKVQMFATPFFGDKTPKFGMCSMTPYPAVDVFFLIFFFIRRKFWIS